MYRNLFGVGHEVMVKLVGRPRRIIIAVDGGTITNFRDDNGNDGGDMSLQRYALGIYNLGRTTELHRTDTTEWRDGKCLSV